MKVGPQEVLHCSNQICVVGGGEKIFHSIWPLMLIDTEASQNKTHHFFDFICNSTSPHFLDPPKCRQKLDDSRQNEAMNPFFSVLHFQQYHQKWWAKYSNPGPILSSSTFTQIDVVIAGQSQGYLLLNLITPRSRIVAIMHTHAQIFSSIDVLLRSPGKWGFGFGWSGGPSEFTF